jgi:hypothetical protein
MVKWKTRGCLRCGGTTYIESDGDGLYEKCLMCSFRVELKKVTGPTEQAVKEEIGS